MEVYIPVPLPVLQVSNLEHTWAVHPVPLLEPNAANRCGSGTGRSTVLLPKPLKPLSTPLLDRIRLA